MKKVFAHVVNHAKAVRAHFLKHHTTYLLGAFGMFALIKMCLFFLTSLGVFHYISALADNEDPCMMTGQIYVEASEVCSTIPRFATGGYEECVIVQSGYWTGGTLDESGVLVDQIYIEPLQSCVITGQTLVEEVVLCATIPGYRTGGTLLCPDEQEVDTGGIMPAVVLYTGVCDSGDIVLGAPLSGAFVHGLMNVSWNYLSNDCVITGNIQSFTLQVYDHNGQWIPLAMLSSLATGYSFDTLLLSGYSNASGFLSSGLYHLVDGSGLVLFTGIASGTYTNLGTGYSVRLLDQNSVVLFTSDVFTIDNALPTLTGITLSSPTASSGVVGLDAEVTLTFTASELLSGMFVSLGGSEATFAGKNGLTYTYTQRLHSGFIQGVVPYSVVYTDLAGNTGTVMLGTGLIFDSSAPIISYMAITGSLTSGLSLFITTSELSRVVFGAVRTGTATSLGFTGTDYITGHVYPLSGIVSGIPYAFRVSVRDIVNNDRIYQGSFMLSLTGIRYFVYEEYVSRLVSSTGTLVSLKSILREELNKFALCKSGLQYGDVVVTVGKNTYTLSVPEFRKAYVKKIVQAFTLFVLHKVENNRALSSSEITDITTKFNNFLVILKLIKDDDNACEHNLSNYYISQFKTAMDEYGMYFR